MPAAVALCCSISAPLKAVPSALAAQYRALAAAADADDPAGLRAGALALGYSGPDDPVP
ncbi:MAG: hypothetical protein IPN92_13850 [Chromatiaceae bacterium]|nr:hypothetical protein [Chromatiaceae bacterium]